MHCNALPYERLTNVLTCSHSLQHLTLVGADYSRQVFVRLGSDWTHLQLRTLVLVDDLSDAKSNRIIDDDAIQAFSQRGVVCEQLQHVGLSVAGLNDASLRTLARLCPNLNHLSLSGSMVIQTPADTWRLVFTQCPRIENLVLRCSMDPPFSDESMSVLIETLAPTLVNFDLLYSEAVSVGTLCKFLRVATRLNSIQFVIDGEVTPDIRQELCKRLGVQKVLVPWGTKNILA